MSNILIQLRGLSAHFPWIAMPRYFFHLKLGQVTTLDHHGSELGDVDQALHEATRRAQLIAGLEALNGSPPASGSIIIDEEFGTAFEFRFGGL